MKNTLYGKDILSAGQFDKKTLELILTTAQKMKQMVKTKGGSQILRGKVMTALFYEPSSRTFGSFVASMQRLGGGFIPLQGVTYSSVSKGESLPDTVRTFASYSDVIVIRHPEVGSARMAADFTEKPVINAGDGVGEHPTQALLDLFTITSHFKKLKNLTVTLAGDLLNGRTIHSLCKLLSLYAPIRLNFVSPDILRLPNELMDLLKERKVEVHEYQKLVELLPTTDVLYVTRVQKERFTDLNIYEKLKHYYVITPEVMKKLKKSAILMHPFPRVGEITIDVDLDPRALYVREQMANGMYIRMALLSLILKK
ncbi:MAG: Aspartate carbamoyltransferase [Candidatus Gottesmanbacteria bacterium GW2011_GWB1_43_11]|uniref:Aspartate carbamoyltransferase n=1 Tax=Candidatus Gottesmanbacteria bacterium GW2011_GWB1_43_11 TaxID=1618446 RepID=A0A0G1ETF4_9BACT|nr:MAG: Aspartate carbamoyltransferase [Candidatus Gottesmanbacteria bacterium GW2011_GWA1_42_26]KKS82007.1 MAG: Aspartate carbamoyltransferase [Candidatus Gottesmanbacteria bacterium GW2011_GWC1_43_10]KKS86366.1 MAG: Aspartate carbamoyltransferase [Candidatus Gottesmanbacteria bacterium GW2011_GWB1_43_11]OGG07978.1 MAG: aspartate carbamoyltransferase [Candidatus Gottesmanbacteria bacterium RIFCSPHIGHO2_01_FULL_43_15]